MRGTAGEVNTNLSRRSLMDAPVSVKLQDLYLRALNGHKILSRGPTKSNDLEG